MTHARAKIWARLIRKGLKSIADAAEADRADIQAAYRELFGEDIVE